MNTREIAAEYRLAHWSRITQECKESGMSIRAFCKAAGFHENIYFYWQRKLRETAYEKLIQKSSNEGISNPCKHPVPKGMVEHTGSCSPTPSGWALCETVDTEPQSGAVLIEIGQCRITAATGVDFELLTKVCRVLVSL